MTAGTLPGDDTVPNDWAGLAGLEDGPALGPKTGDTLSAFEVLREIEERQAAGAAVGDQLAGLGTGERISLGQAEEEIGRVPGRGRHSAAPSTRLGALAARHAGRVTWFSVIGGVVLAAGIAVQALLVFVGAGRYGSYAGQAVFSIEASFLLNRALTWRDRGASFWPACWRFNVQKLLMTIPNFALYALLTWAGLGWLAANLAVTALFLAANYLAGDLWVFAPSRSRGAGRAEAVPAAPLPAGWQPTVSAVVPCKSNEKTILATVESLLGQDYPWLAEVILVGDVGDSTWAALAGVTDPRLVVLEQEKTPGRRDPNVKRDKGIRKACGDVIALADSDIVMDRGWLSKAVGLLREQGGGLVGGGMRAIRPHKFWPRFVDRNALAAKTSRIPRPYAVTAGNFGARNRKPPITANAVITREAYEDCPLDVTWAYGYEDYEWMHRLAADGCKITMSPDLAGAHHHREKFAHLVREYRRSAHGCAQFIRRHPGSRLARKRRAQALALPPLAVAGVVVAVAAVATGNGAAVAGLAVAALAVLAGREVIRSRAAEGAAYPFAALALAGVFASALTAELLLPGADRDAPVWDSAARPRRPRFWRGGHFWVIAAILAAGLAARLLGIGAAPEWQLDEITYASIAENLVRHGTLNVPLAYGQPFQPFLYHPPFYPYELAAWFRVAGQGIAQARVLGALSGTVAFALLALLLARLRGNGAAAFATLLIVFDGWLLYVGRVSYIENSVLVLMMAALLAYQRAAGTGRMRDYLLAGALAGAAGAFNYDAGYLLVVMAAHWAMTRRDHRQHAAALGAALLVLAADALALMRLYTVNGTDWWLHDTLVQVARLTGGQSSAGTITGPGQFLELLARQYDLFLPSVLAVAAALGLLGWRLARCARERSLAPLGPELLLPAWCVGAVAVFGPASLHFSQYFVMVLLPLYSYLWVSLWPVLRQLGGRRAAVASAAVVVALGVGSASLRLRQDSNAFEQFQRYAATQIPRGDLVVAGTAGDPIAYVIGQPWCSPGSGLSAYCAEHAAYVVTWQTYLQPPNPLHLPALQALLAESRPVAEFTQFSGTIIVWKVDR